MEKPNAAAYFRGAERLNCAQAVLKAYAEPAGLCKTCLEQFSQFGGGRAPDGECGALFAAKALLKDPTAKQTLEKEFLDVAGSIKCQEIRKSKSLTCAQCVQVASDAVFLRIDGAHSLQRPSECTTDNTQVA